mmetsp:Transcript_78714/g.163714  ORF Transcript_78714/g.163714 Transcript_78714/m.163714 type:complete len:561 (-) Transcript_78714:516-2198(-)
MKEGTFEGVSKAETRGPARSVLLSFVLATAALCLLALSDGCFGWCPAAATSGSKPNGTPVEPSPPSSSALRAARRLEESAAGAAEPPTAAAEAAEDPASAVEEKALFPNDTSVVVNSSHVLALAGWGGFCSNKCYMAKGFLEDDCQCIVHNNLWYHWKCSKRYGHPMLTQYCDSITCGGCIYQAPPAEPTSPSPSPAARSPTPAPQWSGHRYGSHQACSSDWLDCSSTRRCCNSAMKCYSKDGVSAQCRLSCHPGRHWEDPPGMRQPWTCDVLSGDTTSFPMPSWSPKSNALHATSDAHTHTFYMYRVQNSADYPPENQNMANLAGALWYLHNEIVNNKGSRRFDKTRIQRFRVKTKSTQPLIELGLNFGVRFAFDKGRCTGPYDCQAQWDKFGYFVGCNVVDEWPTGQWQGKVHYPNAVWWSLPGTCTSQLFDHHTQTCAQKQPGGACNDPTGSGTCTYSYESAGEISIDELEGIDSFESFARNGGWEYNNKTDEGVHMTFWNNKYDDAACQWRLDHARQLFHNKYPNMATESDLPEPRCDFSKATFYGNSDGPRLDIR